MTVEPSPSSPIFSDWSVNKGRPEVQLLLLLLRVAQTGKRLLDRGGRAGRVLSAPLVLPYFFYSRFCMAFDVPPSTTIGPRCRIYHAHGIVINASTVIGADVTLRHGTTLGSRVSGSDAPRVGDRVEMGANVMILGDIEIGRGATIGAGSLVLNDVPPGAVTLAGAKARVLSQESQKAVVGHEASGGHDV